MSQQSDWIEVVSPDIEELHKEARSVVVKVSPSPYDMPHQIRSELDQSRRRLVIEFRYMDSEPTKELRLDGHIFAMLGKHSGRVYSLELKMESDSWSDSALHSSFDQAIDSVAKRAVYKVARKKNYALAKSALDTYWSALAGLFRDARPLPPHATT